MAKRFRVIGTATFLNESGQRRAIPVGTVLDMDELDGDPAAVMRWRDESGSPRQQTLSLMEWAQYTKSELKELK